LPVAPGRESEFKIETVLSIAGWERLRFTLARYEKKYSGTLDIGRSAGWAVTPMGDDIRFGGQWKYQVWDPASNMDRVKGM